MSGSQILRCYPDGIKCQSLPDELTATPIPLLGAKGALLVGSAASAAFLILPESGLVQEKAFSSPGSQIIRKEAKFYEQACLIKAGGF